MPVQASIIQHTICSYVSLNYVQVDSLHMLAPL